MKHSWQFWKWPVFWEYVVLVVIILGTLGIRDHFGNDAPVILCSIVIFLQLKTLVEVKHDRH